MFTHRLLFSACCLVKALSAVSPEEQIILVDNFISQDEATTLRQFYDDQKRGLQVHTDNQICLASISKSHPHIQQIILAISNRVLDVMKQKYPLGGKNYHLEHAGIYARIPGNFCGYHADNISFECPIHGKNQAELRMTCNGECAGAKFVPNHTSWREYTGLVYLNDDFEGGEILFEDGPCNKLYRKIINIRPNLLVLAPNGPDFYHEVFQIRSGKRYSLHLWYTSDPNH